ncbi:hypothetical protein GIY56_11990 [Paracoccus sp. YIM 132242]|uniref:Uncharacterized protein n=1 Tax=Paracoccus lichenicola TaxID=2665644 RepID=A0A6L6HPF8_9RHOB|nr:hypothetical protein [Paracoccus lichenicola]MTE01016.1 hypothetical protein [Paracoccus lichenicola]
MFFGKIRIHRELTHLPLKRGDPGFMLGDDAFFGFLVIQLAPVKTSVSHSWMRLAERLWLRCASRRPSTPARMSWQSCSLNGAECRR